MAQELTTWFCNCGTQMVFMRGKWICPKCTPLYEIDAELRKELCDNYVSGFKDGYNRAHDDMVEGIKR